MQRVWIVAITALIACECAPPQGGFDRDPVVPSDGGDPPEPLERRWPDNRGPGYENPIVRENALAGDPRWAIFARRNRAGELEGYADRISAKAGASVRVMVSADAPGTLRWSLYRLGWYGGDGARKVDEGGPLPVGPQPSCPVSPETGVVRCDWATTFTLELASDLVSGLFLIKLERHDGWGSWVPLVVTDTRPSDLLFQASVLTWQAYNDWGGTSLYRDRTGTVPWGRAVHASFERPFAERHGSGQLLRWESTFAQFLERHGYDVSYTTNVDVARGGLGHVLSRGAFLSIGHDEYWPKSLFDTLERARDEGMPILFFSANTAYWQVRLEDEGRTVVGWKENWRHDPDQGPEVTGRFRDAAVNRPENGLLGVMFDAVQSVRSPLVVEDETHWLFEGTGLREGDYVPWLVGYESDRRFDNGAEPPGVEVAARVPVVGVENNPAWAEVTSYRASSGALVFASGTIEWAHGLGAPGIADERVERMTANVFREAIGLEIPDALKQVSGNISRREGPFARQVRTLTRHAGEATAVAPLPDGSVAVVDRQGHRILRVGPAPEAEVTLLAGGQGGRVNADRAVPGANAWFYLPSGLVAAEDGTLYVADTGNHCIRRIRPDEARTVDTIAGRCGDFGFRDGDAGEARFIYPMGLALDPTTGDLLVADSWNHRIRRVLIEERAVRTEAGSTMGRLDGPGDAALLWYPTAVAVDEEGTTYFVASGSFSVGRIDRGTDRVVTTLVDGTPGASDGSGREAGFGPQAGLVWSEGALYVSDAAHGMIRRVVPGRDAAETRVTTLAGRGGRALVDGDGETAEFGLPMGLAVTDDGAILAADAAFGSVRIVEP